MFFSRLEMLIEFGHGWVPERFGSSREAPDSDACEAGECRVISPRRKRKGRKVLGPKRPRSFHVCQGFGPAASPLDSAEHVRRSFTHGDLSSVRQASVARRGPLGEALDYTRRHCGAYSKIAPFKRPEA